MYEAILEKETEKVKSILSKRNNEDPKDVEKFGISTVNLAAYQGSNDIIDLLLDYETRLATKGNGGKGPVSCAVFGDQLHTVDHLINIDENLGR